MREGAGAYKQAAVPAAMMQACRAFFSRLLLLLLLLHNRHLCVATPLYTRSDCRQVQLKLFSK